MLSRTRLILLIFFLAFAARLFYLEQVKDSLLFYYPIVDSGFYDYAGSQIAEGKVAEELPSRIPFYRYFLSMIYKLGGHNVYLARFIQQALGALSCCLIFLLARDVFNEKVALIAGIVSSLYWPLIVFGGKFLPVNLAIFFSLLSIFSAYKFIERKKLIWVIASGVFIALSCLARSNILLFLPVLFLWFFLYFRKGKGAKRAMLCALVFLIGFFLIIAPPLLKDFNKRKEIVPVQKNYGVGLYFGADLERVNIKPGYKWKKLMRELLDKNLVSVKARNIYWLSETKDDILQNPLGYLQNLNKKFYILWNYYEFSPRECVNYFRGQSKFMSLPFFNFGSIAAFSILGMILTWNKKRSAATLLYLFVFTYQLAILLFMPLARYRLPIAPFLIIFASYGALELFERARRREWGDLSKFGAIVIPIFILTNTNLLFPYLDNFSRPRYHSGRAYLKTRGMEEDAISEFKIALAKHPEDADIYKSMGDAYVGIGDLERAKKCYENVLKIESAFPEAMNSLGVIYAKQGRPKDAKMIFKKILSDFPDESAMAHINLGNCYEMEGDYEMAEKEYKRAIFLDPDNLQAVHRLALLYETINHPEAAGMMEKYKKMEEHYSNI